MSAVTQDDFTGNGSRTSYPFTFPYLKASDVKASIDAVDTTAFTLTNATTLQFNTAPANGAKIKIFRETGIDNLTATFYAGSAIKSEDLNDNFTQNLYVTQEVNGRYLSALGGTMTGNFNLGEDADIVFEGATDNANETTITVADPTADRTITFPDTTGTVVTTGDTGTVTGTMIDSGTVTSTNIEDNTIVNADINTSAAIDGTKVNPNFGSQNIATTGTINDLTTTELAILDGATVTTDELNKLDGVTATTAELNIVDGVTASTAEINKLDGVTASTTELNLLDGVTATTTELNLLDGVTATTAEINHVDGVTSNIQTQLNAKQPLDTELTTLAGMQQGTASKLAGSTALTSDIADLNQIDGLTKQTTISDTDASFPTSGAVVDYVTGQIDEIGGFEAITNELSFPNTQPGAGVAVSIADAAGIVVSASGSSTTGRTVGGSTVTINGIPSNFHSSTVANGIRFIVISTGSGQVYNYHKATLAESDLVSLSGDINDFAERYRVGSSNPTSSLDNGDLFFNTSTGKMLVYNGTNSAWEEVQSIGNFFISTLSPAFDGSTQNFTLSDAPTNVQQVLLVINGVIQKPNAGTSTPSEGFALDGSTIKLGAAPATGSTYHAVVMGSTVNIGTPSNNTVNENILQNLSVATGKIQDDAVTADKLANSINAEIAANTAKTTNATHTGEVTGATALTIADDVVDEANLKVSNSPTNGYFLSAQSGNAGGLTWANVDLTTLDAGNLSSGTIPDARFPNPLPAVSGANLTGLSSDSLVKNFTLASGASTTNAKVINTNQSGEVEQFPQLSSTGTPVAATDIDNVQYSKNVATQNYRVKFIIDNDGNAARITLTGQILNADGTVTSSGTTAQFTSGSQSSNSGYVGGVDQWKAVGNTSYWIAYCRVIRNPPTSTSASAARYDRVSLQMFTVNNTTGAIALLGSKYNSNYNGDGGSVLGGNRYRLGSSTSVTMRYNSASVYHRLYTTRQTYQINHYQLTTSGLSQLRNTSANSYNDSYSGTEHLQAWTSDVGQAFEIGGTKTASITASSFDVHDFTGANNRLALDSSTDLNTGTSAYSADGIGRFFENGTHFIYAYRDINNKRKIQTYSYTSAGVFTLIDTLHYETRDSAITASQIGSIKQMVIKSPTEIAILTQNSVSGLYGLSSIKLDSSYNIEGVKSPLFISGIQNTGQKTLHYSGSGDLYFHFNVDSNAADTKVPYTVNNYKDSVAFIYGGVAQETASSGTPKIALGGVATGFTGLTVGTKYYVDPALNGDITTATTSGIVVGTAIKATEMLIGDVR